MLELLKNGAKVNAVNKVGNTALAHACKGKGQAGVLRILLENGAATDINKKNINGHTPLTHAAWNGVVDIAKALLDNGADIDSETKEGMTAMKLAVDKRHEDLARFCLTGGRWPRRSDGGEKSPKVQFFDAGRLRRILLHGKVDQKKSHLPWPRVTRRQRIGHPQGRQLVGAVQPMRLSPIVFLEQLLCGMLHDLIFPLAGGKLLPSFKMYFRRFSYAFLFISLVSSDTLYFLSRRQILRFPQRLSMPPEV